MATILQRKPITGNGTAISATFDSPTTAGSVIVALFMVFEEDETGNISVSSVAGNNSESYSNNAASAGTAGWAPNIWLTRSYYSGNITGRSGHQVTINLSETGFVLGEIVEVGGGGAVDGGSSGSTTGTTVSGSGVTPTASGLHLALAVCLAAGSRTWTAGTGWTEDVDSSDGSDWSWTLMSRAAAASASQTASATASGTVFASTITHIVIADGVAPVTVDSVTPDTFEDGETGIEIAGSDFGASQGDGRVVISPVDNIAGEPSETPATVVSSTLPNQANPTTSFTITVPACQVDDLLEVTFLSRDHTSGTAHPTVSDDQSGTPGWTQAGFSSERQAHVFWRRATSGVAGSTITVSGCVGSSCGGLRVIRGALASGDPYADFVWEENASGNETHAGFTPTHNNSLVNFMVANDTNDTLTVTNMAAATLGTFEPEDYTDLSTGGNDCAIYVSGRGQSGTATGTGNFTWSQTNATTISGTWAIRPKVPAGAAVEQTVTSWSDTAIEFTAVQDTLTAGVDLYLFV
jgi:hypothetical protein